MSPCLAIAAPLYILDQAEQIITQRPSLTLLVLSASLFATSALLQRLSRRAPAPPAPRTQIVHSETEQTSL